ncbi:nuclear transport factor 2 family protein [Novosphingobium sp. G106]|uniref:nuclear transport factor 2 family protein n=1 Tax=Novosphingobium sp. G106 TaxID=2849500 RepID=UPI001C2D227D|nr:nuclear transport factor 2 family protein [Novosphingobium sp. G106]MBV1688946.1 nuclear transport factor 2 family protein [Novosphingobium sp. G106]
MNSESLPAEVQTLIDRQAISDCLQRYSRGIDRRDREILRSVYHEDAWDDHAVFCGPAEKFADWAYDFHAKYQTRHHHYILNHSCEFDGDVAHCETYYLFAGVNREGPEVTLSGGRYLDRFEKRDGRWAIAARKCLIEWMGTLNDVPSDPAYLAALASSGLSARSGEDSSYDRPLVVDRPEQVFPY